MSDDSIYLLDASAVMTLLEDEDGAERLKAAQRISLADSIVAGFASVYGAVLVHNDPEFESLAGEMTMEALSYKG